MEGNMDFWMECGSCVAMVCLICLFLGAIPERAEYKYILRNQGVKHRGITV